MGYSVKIFLDTRQAKKDNTYPIKLRFRAYGKPGEIRLDYAVLPKYWDKDKKAIQTICKSIPKVRRANIKIQEKKTHALTVLSQLEDNGELHLMSSKEIKEAIISTRSQNNRNATSTKNAVMVIALANERIAELKSAGKIGNAGVYVTMRNSISTYIKPDDIPLERITYKWLRKYEAWYLGRTNSKGKPNTYNGLAVNLRTLRALFNEAIKRKLIVQDAYPFKEYRIKHEKTRKRAISQEDINKIKAYEPTTLRQERAKDYFLMSFYLMGASFIDLAFLRMNSIQNDRIEYKRRKTGKLHSIKITAPLKAILDKYTTDKSGDDYILPVIKTDDLQQQYNNLANDIRRYNKSLKEIGVELGLSSTLTSYVARHSFATIAKFKDVPISVISQALGHSNTETTEIYLSEFDNEILDKYNDMIVGE